MTKDSLIYFKGANLNYKNLKILNNFFNIIKINEKNDIKKINNKNKIKAIYCDQKNFLDRKFLKNFINLNFLVSPTTSTDFIDKSFCKKKKIEIISLESEQKFLKTVTPTAEHSLGLIIAISRNYYNAITSVKNNKFNRRLFGGYKMLSRSSLGIIGYGRLGKILKKMSKNIFSKIYTADIKSKKKYKSNLNKIFKKCDFVSLHIPSKKNYNFFSKKKLPIFSKPFFLINTSRGDVVDEQFIVKNLKNNMILGYATDVIKNEFKKDFLLKKNLFYKKMKKLNILITPHIGGSTYDAWFQTEKKVIDNLIKKYK